MASGLGRLIGTLTALCSFFQACSPTGPESSLEGRIAFLGGGSNQTLEILAGRPDGSGVTRIVGDLPDFVDLAWSPDATILVYSTNFGGTSKFEIFTIKVDGTGNTKISPDGRMPAWSPDGSTIAFIAMNDATRSFDIFAMDVNGSGVRALTETSDNELWPAWSPEGNQIAYEAGGRSIFVMDANGANPRRITNTGNAAVGAPAWSPDGTRIAFNSTMHRDQSSIEFGQFEIYLMNADGSDVERLTFLSDVRRALRFPTWSADGRFIAFESQVEIELGFIYRVYTIGSDGSNPSEVRFGRGAKSPKWSPR